MPPRLVLSPWLPALLQEQRPRLRIAEVSHRQQAQQVRRLLSKRAMAPPISSRVLG